ncbi:sensor histidine kinase [Cereibacter changlensis]|uniref:sensor histidine kinase n=1 Tax=Cereibacter changlensis TaxID=402884 RepID=UPI0040337F6C
MNFRLGRHGRFADRIGFRFAFLLAVALLPLGVISIVQSAAVMREAAARSEAALTGETMRAAEHEVRLIQRAQGSAAALSQVIVPLLDEAEACEDVMAAVQRDSQAYSVVGYIRADGMMACSSAEPFAFSNSELVTTALEAMQPTLQMSLYGPVSKTSVVVVSHPVLDGLGNLLGIVVISLPHDALFASGNVISGLTPPVLMTFNRDGKVLTSSVGLEHVEDILPKDRALKALAGESDLAFTAATSAGLERVFSVVPIIPGTLYALGSWDKSASNWATHGAPASLLPALMWIACLMVAWLASERLMTRHIRSLRSAITAFSSGSRSVDKHDFGAAPLEIRQLAEAFDRMTDTILHDEAELEDMVHQKEVLLREVHHRVKNNLQLIASIMNMQMRQARTPEAKGLMKGLQDRVMSLATIHRGLYQTSGLTDIRTDELLSDIVRQVVNLATGPGRRIEVHTDFGDLRLTPDQAVPLSLLLTEALTNAMKYAGAAEGQLPRLDVSLRRQGEVAAVLEVTNTVGTRQQAAETIDHGTGLGAQLLSGFAQQIGGHVEVTDTDDIHSLSVTFDVRPLSDAEARNATATAEADG